MLADDVLTLRAFEPGDAGAIAEAAQDPLIPAMTSVPSVPDPAELLAYIERQHQRLRDRWGYSFAVARNSDDECVGQIGLWLRDLVYGRASIGYWITPTARRRGHAKDALEIISRWVLALERVFRLELYVEPRNEASWRAAERVGYEREGLLRCAAIKAGEILDQYMYAKVRPPAERA